MGLEFLYKTLMYSEALACSGVAKQYPFEGIEFGMTLIDLPDQIRWLPSLPTTQISGDGNGPNEAWLWSCKSDRCGQDEKIEMRKWGYVMWDKSRLSHMKILMDDDKSQSVFF